jgi:hypothetical protein
MAILWNSLTSFSIAQASLCAIFVARAHVILMENLRMVVVATILFIANLEIRARLGQRKIALRIVIHSNARTG